MRSRIKRNGSLGLIFLLIFPLLFGIFESSMAYPSDNKHNIKGNSILELTSSNNISFDCSFPNWIWIEGQLTMKIISNFTGTLEITFVEASAGSFFGNVINLQISLLGNNQPQTVLIRIAPYLTTLPRVYNFSLIVSHVETSTQIYTQEFETILGMGPTILFAVLIVFGMAIIVILTRKSEIDDKKASTSASTGTSTGSGSIPEGKIKCPKCKKLIEEGSTFCPECGERIPSFLQFNPDSNIGIS